MALLEGLKAPQDDKAEYVFGANGKTQLGNYSQIKADRDGRMVELMGGEFDWETMEIVEPGKFKPWRFHDLRRTGDTNMHRLKVPDTVVDKVLNHTIGGVRGIYNRYEYFDEKFFELRTESGCARYFIVVVHSFC
jgi:integrase